MTHSKRLKALEDLTDKWEVEVL